MYFSRALLRFGRESKTFKRCMSDYTPTKFRVATMNDAPIPHEPFEIGYKKRQIGNNFTFVAGLIFFSVTFAFVSQSGVMVPNLTPPKKNLGE